MALNPQYEDIGKTFVAQYYALFDDPSQRINLVHLFNVSKWQTYINFYNFSETIDLRTQINSNGYYAKYIKRH